VPSLVIKRPDGKMGVYQITGRGPCVTVIGRSQDANVVLSDPSVSRIHAQVWTEKEFWFVDDTKSENGLTVEGIPTSIKTRLNPGTQFGIGKFRLWFIGEDKDDQFVDGRFIGYLPPWINQSTHGEELTFRLTAPEKRRILQAMERMDEATINRIDGSGHWNPGEKKLTFGKLGSVQVKGWFTGDVVAEIMWDEHYQAHVLRKVKPTGWAKVTIGGDKVSTRALRPGDAIQIGRSRFRYVIPKSSR
jgi:hypothetical protein